MRHTTLTPLFPILALVLAFTMWVAPAQASDVLVLEWNDTYKELVPGYRVSFTTHGVAIATASLSAFADAVACIGGHCYGLVGDDGITPVNVELYIDGEKTRIDRLWLGKKEYDEDWVATLYCPGEKPEGAPGSPPNSNYSWLKVENTARGIVDWKLVDVSEQAPDMKYFYESTLGLRSWVEFTDPVQLQDCGYNKPGEPPSGGEGNRPGSNTSDRGSSLAWLGLGAAAAGLLGYLLVGGGRR